MGVIGNRKEIQVKFLESQEIAEKHVYLNTDTAQRGIHLYVIKLTIIIADVGSSYNQCYYGIVSA